MKLSESKSVIGRIAINEIASAVKDLSIDEAYETADAICRVKFKGGYWMYKGGSHIALMAKDFHGNSTHYAMYIEE